jgi:glycosyltransferase involved in cell wall biosynthesis
LESSNTTQKAVEPPRIEPLLTNEETRPFWSVMIPVYNAPESYLEETLRSVLQQDPGPEVMQIEVVDDCSPNGTPAALIRRVAGDRVSLNCAKKNRGLAGTWNRCIELARGEWVHILHQDDYVLPGFYNRISKAAKTHPSVSLIATRSFFIDSDGIITGVTNRYPNMESGSNAVADFFYETPIQCPGVVVKRSAYEQCGGFRSDLAFMIDREMWVRAIAFGGGLITPEVLSCYRMSVQNETMRLRRSGEGLRDIERLIQIFEAQFPGFDPKIARQDVYYKAIDQAERFAKAGDSEAAKANLDFWRNNAPVWLRLRRAGVKIARGVFG